MGNSSRATFPFLWMFGKVAGLDEPVLPCTGLLALTEQHLPDTECQVVVR